MLFEVFKKKKGEKKAWSGLNMNLCFWISIISLKWLTLWDLSSTPASNVFNVKCQLFYIQNLYNTGIRSDLNDAMFLYTMSFYNTKRWDPWWFRWHCGRSRLDFTSRCFKLCLKTHIFVRNLRFSGTCVPAGVYGNWPGLKTPHPKKKDKTDQPRSVLSHIFISCLHLPAKFILRTRTKMDFDLLTLQRSMSPVKKEMIIDEHKWDTCVCLNSQYSKMMITSRESQTDTP